ncbi:hypothetical protein K9M74_00740 [Candidatus Woesearchaeota archaeon]|nr:hypothetical protein [Candidatus Woesearchaeota archaeon]
MNIQVTSNYGALINGLQHGDVIPSGISFMGANPELLFDIDNLDARVLKSFFSPEKRELIDNRFMPKFTNLFEHDYFKKRDSKLDARLFAIAEYVALSAQQLLGMSNKQPDPLLRNKLFRKGIPSLSDLKGNAMCTELASVGQYLIHHLLKDTSDSNYESNLAIGYVENYLGDDESHAFIPIFDKNTDKQYVFDIARPDYQGAPRISLLNKPFTIDFFLQNPNHVIGGESMCSGLKEKYFM